MVRMVSVWKGEKYRIEFKLEDLTFFVIQHPLTYNMADILELILRRRRWLLYDNWNPMSEFIATTNYSLFRNDEACCGSRSDELSSPIHFCAAYWWWYISHSSWVWRLLSRFVLLLLNTKLSGLCRTCQIPLRRVESLISASWVIWAKHTVNSHEELNAMSETITGPELVAVNECLGLDIN